MPPNAQLATSSPKQPQQAQQAAHRRHLRHRLPHHLALQGLRQVGALGAGQVREQVARLLGMGGCGQREWQGMGEGVPIVR